MDHRAALNRRLLFYTLYLAYISAGIISILPGPTLSLLAMHTGVPLDVAGWIFTTSASGFVIGVMIAGLLTAVLRPKHLLMIGMSLTDPFIRHQLGYGNTSLVLPAHNGSVQFGNQAAAPPVAFAE